MLNSGAEIRSELAHGTRSIPQSGQIHALDHRLKGGTYDAAIFGIARLDWPWFLEATLAPGPVRSTIESRNGEPSWHMRSAMVPGTTHDRCKGWRGRAPARICKTAIGPGRMHGTKGESRRRHPSEPPNGPEDVRPDARRGAGLSQSVSGRSCANNIEWLLLLLLLALPVTGDEEKAPDSANPAAVALLPCQRRLWALSPGCPASRAEVRSCELREGGRLSA